MANESALRDGNGEPTLLYEQNGETRRVSDINPLPVNLTNNTLGLKTTTLEKVGPGTITIITPTAGKKLAGAALTSFMTKCEKNAQTACDKQAADRKLAGAAKDSFNKKCTADAVGS